MRKQAEEAVFPDDMKVLLVCVNKVYNPAKIDTYHAARYSWAINPEKAQQAAYVMAVFKGAIVGVFEADEWLPAKKQHFLDLPPEHGNWEHQGNDFGFVGRPASKDIEERYRDKSVPKQWGFGRGNPIRYVNF